MSKELEAQEKMEVTPESELTRPQPVFQPAVDIYESQDKLTLIAEMPGVTKDGLSINLQDNILTIYGTVASASHEDRKTIHREYNVGDYRRGFTLSDQIDQTKITAAIKNGVLILSLPKVEESQPRQIEITTG